MVLLNKRNINEMELIKMDFIREIINSDKLENIIFIPENMNHKNVEILILPVQEKKSGIGKLRGALKKYANSELIEKESEAWEMAVTEKYRNR